MIRAMDAPLLFKKLVRKPVRGMSFMDVIIGTALTLIIFTALVGLLRSSLQVASLAKNRSVATTVAESQMEYIRSLSYDQVGTVGGIPAGNVPQISTTTQNGIAYPTRTVIEYVDDPADGVGNADSNGITTDYKRIKVSVSYYAAGRNQTVDLVSNYAPPGIETTTGGGTLKINIVSAAGAGVPGASVRIQNASSTPAIDFTTFSDVNGTVYLPGAPTSTQYQISVFKSGYSSAQTYARDANNQNPTPGYLTVVRNQTTTGTFAIDTFAQLTVRTFLPIATTTFLDTFSSSANVASLNNTAVTGGALQLLSGGSGYALSGTARSITIAPTYLSSWSNAQATTSLPSGTSIRVHVVDGRGTLLPDTVIPGNASGFTSSVNLSTVSTSTYPALALTADLSTNATTTTPLLQDWLLTYQNGPIPLPGIPFTLTGAKAIGTTGAGVPIVKTVVSTSTDSTGSVPLSLEWDVYGLKLPGYDATQACNDPPYSLAPGTRSETSLTLALSTPNMMLVTVSDDNGSLPGATVTLSRSGFTKTVTSDSCGSAYFGSLTSAAYSLGVSKSGYTTFNASNISVSGHVFYPTSL